jgi:hypothetical protein
MKTKKIKKNKNKKKNKKQNLGYESYDEPLDEGSDWKTIFGDFFSFNQPESFNFSVLKNAIKTSRTCVDDISSLLGFKPTQASFIAPILSWCPSLALMGASLISPVAPIMYMTAASFGLATVYNLLWWKSNAREIWWKRALTGVAAAGAVGLVCYGLYQAKLKTDTAKVEVNKEGKSGKSNRLFYNKDYDDEELAARRDQQLIIDDEFERRFGGEVHNSRRQQQLVDAAIERQKLRWQRAKTRNAKQSATLVGSALLAGYGVTETTRYFTAKPDPKMTATPNVVQYAYVGGACASLVGAFYFMGFKPKKVMLKYACATSAAIMLAVSIGGWIRGNPISPFSWLPKGVRFPAPTSSVSAPFKESDKKASKVSVPKQTLVVVKKSEAHKPPPSALKDSEVPSKGEGKKEKQKRQKKRPKSNKESNSVSPQIRIPPVYSVYAEGPNGRIIRICCCFRSLDYLFFPAHAWDVDGRSKFSRLLISDGAKKKVSNGRQFLVWYIPVEFEDKSLRFAYMEKDTGVCIFPLKGVTHSNKIKSSQFMLPPPDYEVKSGDQVIMFTNKAQVTAEVQSIDPPRDDEFTNFKTQIIRHNGTTKKGDCGSPVVKCVINSSTSIPTSYQLIGFHEEGANTASKFNGVLSFAGILSFLGEGSQST